MVHGGHAPTAIGFAAHGHAAAMELSARGLDGEIVLVPDGFADGMEGALRNFQAGRGFLVKILIAKISRNLLASVELSFAAEEHDFCVEAVAESLFVGLVERRHAAM